MASDDELRMVTRDLLEYLWDEQSVQPEGKKRLIPIFKAALALGDGVEVGE